MNITLMLLALSLGDPIPKETAEARIEREWGKFVDSSEKKATIKLSGDKLKMSIPAGSRRFRIGVVGDNINVPFLYKEMEGDFVATVNVHRHVAPESATANHNDIIMGSGLLAIFDEKTAITYCRATSFPKLDWGFYCSMCYLRGGMTSKSAGTLEAQQESVFLRLTRTGDLLEMEYSYDRGKKWRRFTQFSRPTNHAVKVGVYAEHSCDAATEATFSDFSLKAKVKEDEKKEEKKEVKKEEKK